MVRHGSGKGDRGPTQRQLRVGETLRHALSEVLARRDLRDPALADRSITVSEVMVSADLRNATAYVLPLGGADTDTVIAGLERAAAHLGARVAGGVRLKRVPRLSFVVDTSFDRAGQLDQLLRAVLPDSEVSEDADG